MKGNRLETHTSIASKRENLTPYAQRFMLQSYARSLLPDERVAKCLRMIAPSKSRVEVHKSKTTRKARYKNLIVCGSVWQCPVCASYISEKRRIELSDCINRWTGGLILLTYTASHRRGAPLKPFLSSILETYRSLKSGRWFEEAQEYYGWIGSVRSLEITYGENGWHPHIHELVFTTNQIEGLMLGGLESAFRIRWIDKLKANKQYASTDRGFKAQDGWNEVSDYITKIGDDFIRASWSPAHEIAKQVSKKGKRTGKTPMQLLAEFSDGNTQSGDLWREYATTLKGRNHIVWSRGLRETLNAGNEKSDQEIAEEMPPNSYLLASLTPGEWKAILAMDLRAEVLTKAERLSDDDFGHWLDNSLKSWFQGD